MIDPHVHLRDWNWKHKETIEHGLIVAEKAGLDAVFDMPNTEPVITTEELVKKRLGEAEEAQQKLFAERRGFVFYGFYVGVTPDIEQVKEAVRTWREFFPKPGDRVGVIGLKMFAGHSVGNLGIVNEQEQKQVYRTLAEENYKGVLAVHCEKESELRNKLWDSSVPITHCWARPEKAEYESVRDQIEFTREVKFLGNLHILHVSTNDSMRLILQAKNEGLRISCEVTPHHCVLDETYMSGLDGMLYKVNPPLRRISDKVLMFEYLKTGKVDWIATDHAPHTYNEKTGRALDKKGNPIYMSGFPGLPFYPHFINYLRRQGFSAEKIRDLTHRNIERIFGIEIPELRIKADLNLHTEYEVDVYEQVRERWKANKS